jgi:hypothetical protein
MLPFDPSVSGIGAWMVTKDLFFFLLSLVRELARDWARLRVPLRDKMPPGDGSDAICDIEAEVWSSEVEGSK